MPQNLPCRAYDDGLMTGLALSPKAAFQSYAASLAGGALAFAAIPNVMLACVAFTAATYLVSEAMDQRALENGDVVVRTYKRPARQL